VGGENEIRDKVSGRDAGRTGRGRNRPDNYSGWLGRPRISGHLVAYSVGRFAPGAWKSVHRMGAGDEDIEWHEATGCPTGQMVCTLRLLRTGRYFHAFLTQHTGRSGCFTYMGGHGTVEQGQLVSLRVYQGDRGRSHGREEAQEVSGKGGKC